MCVEPMFGLCTEFRVSNPNSFDFVLLFPFFRCCCLGRIISSINDGKNKNWFRRAISPNTFIYGSYRNDHHEQYSLYSSCFGKKRKERKTEYDPWRTLCAFHVPRRASFSLLLDISRAVFECIGEKRNARKRSRSLFLAFAVFFGLTQQSSIVCHQETNKCRRRFGSVFPYLLYSIQLHTCRHCIYDFQ